MVIFAWFINNSLSGVSGSSVTQLFKMSLKKWFSRVCFTAKILCQ